jgi:uncharacterized protein YdiU (UPF0061 family)
MIQMDLAELRFEINFVRELPATRCRQRAAPGAKCKLHARRADAGRGAAAARMVGTRSASIPADRPAVAEAIEDPRGQQGAAGDAAVRGALRRHQFGVWAGQLGDGRAITLGEVIAADGTRHELQLKGAGRTPYARTADGRAVLRSSLREFLCSEAMHFLGVPTTRALRSSRPASRSRATCSTTATRRTSPARSCAASRRLSCASAISRSTSRPAKPSRCKRLHAYVVRNYYPDQEADWFHVLCRRTAMLIADWMRLGFVHGVMNTDNMSILGVTIDYGPYGWLEGYDPSWTPNTTDAETRRYCYGNQPEIALWNLARLAEAPAAAAGQGASRRRARALRANLRTTRCAAALAQKLGFSAVARCEGRTKPDRRFLQGCSPACRNRQDALLPQSRQDRRTPERWTAA